ncbi:hypothetical protein SIIN_7040_T [Serendipita indica DSM 11827]|nr:hypothetical protein SIIN_7040_T [Serendipita indica DSM 11827]
MPSASIALLIIIIAVIFLSPVLIVTYVGSRPNRLARRTPKTGRRAERDRWKKERQTELSYELYP